MDENNLTLIDALISDIINDLSPEERFGIADLKENELQTLQLLMGKYMKFRIEQLKEQGNRELLKECQKRSGEDSMEDIDAAAYILKEIWVRIRETAKLRVVK
jgi:hypothetical protein